MKKDNDYLLSIDGSTVSTGWSIFDKKTNKLIDYGVIKHTFQTSLSKQESADNRRERILYMIDELQKVITKYKPNEAVAEDVPPTYKKRGNNSVTVLALGTLQGAMLGLSHMNNIPIHFVSVSTWHSCLGILKSKGDLKKQSIEWANTKHKISFLYKSPSSKFNQDDIADSICIGSFYLGNYQSETKTKLGVRTSRLRKAVK